MVTALESKAALLLLSDDAAETVEFTVRRSSGSFESRRLTLLDEVPGVVGYYSEGSAALAADFYDEYRADAGIGDRFRAEAVVLDRTVKIRRGVAWASEPLSVDDDAAAIARLTEVLQSELARPYRDTILTNQQRDKRAGGYQRIASPTACGFCKMLAGRGAVYKERSAFFAAHGNCMCTAQPWFNGQPGEEASVIQYMASKRNRTPATRQRIRDYIAANYPDEALRKHVTISRD